MVKLELDLFFQLEEMFNNGFKPTVQKLLCIEQFCQKQFNKIKTKSFKEIRASSSYNWKAFNEWDFGWLQKI